MVMTIGNPETLNIVDDERWQAVQERDRQRDGDFVFAVSSTGIYCRPSCPARRPRPENVRFFGDSAGAERAGFRPCRRCRPRAEATPRAELVARAVAWLDEHVDERVTLSDLARHVGASAGHLQRTFTREMGVSPRDYAAASRLELAKSRLRDGANVTSALYAAGYGSSSRFYAQARSELGMSPSTYRRGGEGLTIGFTTADSPVGRLLIASTKRGICAVTIGDDDAALVAALEAEYPRATIERDDEGLQSTCAAVLGETSHPGSRTSVAIDVPGTPFQREVWQALRGIPRGERRSYAQVAASIGRPSAARAVASACAANPAAIVIPCHRVVRGDGAMGGYRWGEKRKQALLELERGT